MLKVMACCLPGEIYQYRFLYNHIRPMQLPILVLCSLLTVNNQTGQRKSRFEHILDFMQQGNDFKPL